MTLQKERQAIEAYFIGQWAAATPVIPDGQIGEPVADSVRLTIQSGARLQGTIGRSQNVIWNMGMLTATIYTSGDAGSAAWRGYAETIIGFLHGVTLDDAGTPITAVADAFLRFSPVGPNGREEQHPYLAASFKDAPFHITNVIAPFARYSLA